MTSHTALVFRADLLPGSETFIRNQLAAMSRWNPLPVGIRRIDSALSEPGDTVLFGDDRIGTLRRRAFWLDRRSATLQALAKRPDVGVIHAHFGPDATLVVPVSRRTKTPLVATFHGQDVTRTPKETGRKADIVNARLKVLFHEAAALLAVSDFIAGQLAALGAPESKILVHHIGIPVTAQRSHEPADRSGIVFVGRLVQKKGCHDLLDAVAAMPEPWRSTSVTVIGDGPLRGALEAHSAQLGLQASFPGELPPADVMRHLDRCAVFCVPSQTAPTGDAEGLGMVFLEAALAGRPVVSYRHGGVSEAVIDEVTGLLAPEKDVTALSERLLRVLRDPALGRALGDAGRQRIETDFDIARQTGELEDIYDRVAGVRSRTAAATS